MGSGNSGDIFFVQIKSGHLGKKLASISIFPLGVAILSIIQLLVVI